LDEQPIVGFVVKHQTLRNHYQHKNVHHKEKRKGLTWKNSTSSPSLLTPKGIQKANKSKVEKANATWRKELRS